MRPSPRLFPLLLSLPLFPSCASAPDASNTPQGYLERSAQTVDHLRATNDTFDYFLERSKAVLVFPEILHGGVVFAGAGGVGVLVERGATGEFGPVSFYSAHGVSFGAQAGVERAMVAVVILNDRLIQSLREGSLDLGAGVSMALGSADAKATASLQAFRDAYIFRDAKGAFAGLSLDGTLVNSNSSLNTAYRQGPKDGEAEMELRKVLAVKPTES